MVSLIHGVRSFPHRKEIRVQYSTVTWPECYNAIPVNKSLIAFDLETTGLDTARDAVIEIGAVRFRGDRIEEQFQTLVNPGRPLDPVIVELTGLNDAMLGGAPRLKDVIDDFNTFVGDLPLLGHNVQFDLAFMLREGLFHENEYLDTFDLASVLLPASSRYNLRALAQELGIPVFESHLRPGF
jgi:DNA polymerase III epsilon subunit family exonuclease